MHDMSAPMPLSAALRLNSIPSQRDWNACRHSCVDPLETRSIIQTPLPRPCTCTFKFVGGVWGLGMRLIQAGSVLEYSHVYPCLQPIQ